MLHQKWVSRSASSRPQPCSALSPLWQCPCQGLGLKTPLPAEVFGRAPSGNGAVTPLAAST